MTKNELTMLRLKKSMLQSAVNAVDVFKKVDKKKPEKTQNELQKLWEQQRISMGLEPKSLDRRQWK